MTPQQAIDAARLVADALLTLVPAPVARQMLSDAEVRRANAIADAAEDLKFGRVVIDDGPPEGDQS